MIQLITRPNYFQIGNSICPGGGQYRIILSNNLVGVRDVRSNADIAIPTIYTDWVDEDNMPFATLDDLIDTLTRANREDVYQG